MHKYTHIDAFYQVARYIDKMSNDPECPEEYKIRTPVEYRGTVKLHGSNVGVSCTSEGLVAQSRTRVITPGDDNYGFAAFVARPEVTAAIQEIAANIRDMMTLPTEEIVLYGEWVGPGVQSGVAINNLPSKQWVLFAVKSVRDSGFTEYLDVVPQVLSKHITQLGIYSIRSAPWYRLHVDFTNPASKELAIEQATKYTEAVEAECPWARRFDVKGTGEGIVWVPVGEHWGNSMLFFKTKGDKHKVTKSKSEKPQLAPEVLAGVESFVDFAVTENRLKQGLEALQEAGHSLEMKSMGHFLKWVSQDVQRECAAELEENDLDWSLVNKSVTQRARDYFKNRLQSF